MSMIKRQHTFSFDYESKTEKRTFNGKFTTRILSFMDKQKVNVRTSQLCGGMYCVRDDNGNPTGHGVDEETEFNMRMFAWLETCLVQKPEWFRLDGTEGAVVDEELVFAVFKEVTAFEGSFRGLKRETSQGEGGPAQSSAGTGTAEHPASDDGGAPKKVVGSEVQASLDA